MEKIWPMGCKKIDRAGLLEQLLADPNYIAQEKLDGVRALMHVTPQGTFFTTRGATYEDPDTPIDITHRLPHMPRLKSPRYIVLDGELMSPCMTSAEVAGMVSYKSTVPVSPRIHFYVFDVLWCGSDLREVPLSKRLSILTSLEMAVLQNYECIRTVAYFTNAQEKQYLLTRVLSTGREGIVLKNLTAKYYDGKKKAGVWYKYKKKDTTDVRITGAEPPERWYRHPETNKEDFTRETKPYQKGWIGSVTFEFEEDGVTYQGSTAGLTDELREMLSDGSHCISPQYINRLMEVEFMEKTKDGNLRHPRFVRLREPIEK